MRLGAPPEIRTRNLPGLSRSRLPIAPAGHVLVDGEGVEPSRPVPTSGLQPGALPFERPILCSGGPGGVRTHTETTFKVAATANCATGPVNYPSRYRKCLGMVWAAGLEPAQLASEARTLPTELHPEVGGRGRLRCASFIMRAIIMGISAGVNP